MAEVRRGHQRPDPYPPCHAGRRGQHGNGGVPGAVGHAAPPDVVVGPRGGEADRIGPLPLAPGLLPSIGREDHEPDAHGGQGSATRPRRESSGRRGLRAAPIELRSVFLGEGEQLRPLLPFVEDDGAEDVGHAFVRREGGRLVCEGRHGPRAFGTQPGKTDVAVMPRREPARTSRGPRHSGRRRPTWSPRWRVAPAGSSRNTPGSVAVASPLMTVGGFACAWRIAAAVRSRRSVSGQTQARSQRASSGSRRSIGERSIPIRDANGGSCAATGGCPPTTWQEIWTAASTGPVAPCGP